MVEPMVDVVHRRGSVADLHAADPFAGGGDVVPQVWWCDFVDAALVLGSRQTPDLLDLAACERAGLAVARRRSGGGAVLLRPDAVIWIDVVLPTGVAPDDVRASMVWIGERWREALGGNEPALTVHAGGMVATPWSELVCFAGLGPGEVVADGRKLVGLSQRRTRHGVRLQGLVHRRDLLPEMPDLFADPGPAVPLEAPAVRPSLDAATVAGQLAERLASLLAERSG